MIRHGLTAALLLLASSEAFAHGSEAAPPPPPAKGPAVAPAQVARTPKGSVLADPRGMTLYYFDRDDTGNKSTCDGPCTERWIPFAAPAGAEATGDFTLIIRSDGSRMWAYRYRPLYFSREDKGPGDLNGAGLSEHWHLARPAF